MAPAPSPNRSARLLVLGVAAGVLVLVAWAVVRKRSSSSVSDWLTSGFPSSSAPNKPTPLPAGSSGGASSSPNPTPVYPITSAGGAPSEAGSGDEAPAVFADDQAPAPSDYQYPTPATYSSPLVAAQAEPYNPSFSGPGSVGTGVSLADVLPLPTAAPAPAPNANPYGPTVGPWSTGTGIAAVQPLNRFQSGG